MHRFVLYKYRSGKALYTPRLGEQSGVKKDSTMKVYIYLGYRNIAEILKVLKEKMN